jgi:hypothetical protein
LYLIDRVRKNYFQHTFKPGEGIEVVKLAGSQQRIEHGAALSSFMASGE